MILRRYERRGAAVEVADEGDAVRATLHVTPSPGMDAVLGSVRCATISEAESWARRWLHLDETEQLPLAPKSADAREQQD